MTAPAPREGRRRALHVATGSLGLAVRLGAPPVSITIILGTLLALALALEVLRRRRPSLNATLYRLSGGALRPAESHGITGATLLVAGYAATWLVFAPTRAAPAILVTALADPAAALVGRLAAPAGSGKTWTGTTAAWAAASLSLILFGLAPLRSLAVGAIAALCERLPGRGLDNLTIPLATAAALRFST